MNTNDQYALNWSNHTNHIRKAFDTLLAGNEFVDVTLSCEGKKISAHKILLSACSTYFHELFRDNPCQHPIVILRDVKFQNLLDILKFIYNGEVSVSTENFDSFLKTAELLQVSGLTDDDGRYEAEKEDTAESARLDETKQVSTALHIRDTCEQGKEITKKRPFEDNAQEVQKKRREEELKADVEIKEEALEAVNVENEIRDPLEIGRDNAAAPTSELEAGGSHKYQITSNDLQVCMDITEKPINQKSGKMDNAQFHYLEPVKATAKAKSAMKRCRQCSKNKERHKSRYFCPICPEEPGLCVSTCFKTWHMERLQK